MEAVGRTTLASPTTDELWAAYHDIRRTILFEGRGRFGVYDASHPDEHKANYFPKLLLLDGSPIGTIRIDIHGEIAHFRLVAIAESHQRRGFGHALLVLAEAFARERGATRVKVASAPDAVGFYQRSGYQFSGDADQPDALGMAKQLAKACP